MTSVDPCCAPRYRDGLVCQLHFVQLRVPGGPKLAHYVVRSGVSACGPRHIRITDLPRDSPASCRDPQGQACNQAG